MALICCLILLADSVLAGQSLEHQASIAKGKATYQQACLLCHGKAGKGDGPDAFFLGAYSAPRPRDFTTGTFKFRSTLSGEVPTDQDLFRTITYGIPGYMPPFQGLSEDARWAVIAYLKTFSLNFVDDDSPPLSLNTTPPPFISPNVTQGGTVYIKMGCSSCHDSHRQGSNFTLYAGSPGNPSRLLIVATNLSQPSSFKNGTTPSDIARSILTGLDGTPMPSFWGAFSSENDLWDLVAYILSLSGTSFP